MGRQEQTNHLFSNRDLRILLVPLIVEQILNSLMGTADSIMVSNVGSAAISAVALVDSINILVIQAFYALAAGGTIVCSQYIGQKDKKNAEESARQLSFVVACISSAVMAVCLLTRGPLLRLIFGSVEVDVMEAAQIYFFYTALSFPFIALYDAGSSIYRAQGNTRLPMTIAVVSNGLNIAGNAVLIWGFHLGVAGAAIATLGSRVISAVVVFAFLHNPSQEIAVRDYLHIRPDGRRIMRILSLGIPNGIENAMFQFGKLAIQSTVSTLGTIAIAAQAMTNILENLNGIAAIGIGIGMMTVVGQCLGAGRKDEAIYYIKKLTAVAEIVIIASCALVFLATKPVTILGGMEPESAKMCLYMVGWITVVKPIVWTLAFIPAYGMRAAGDVRFSMILSCISMWAFRVTLCIYLCRVHGFGPIAVWIGMFTDWTIRGIVFTFRFMGRRWLAHKGSKMKMELQILDWIQQMRTPVGDIWMVFISRLGNAGMIWILFTCLLLMIPRTRRWGAALAAALCLDAIICNILLKPMVCRIRPCDVNQTVQLLIARPADYSFPSGHTAASFAAVAALYFAGAKKWWKITLPLAILMAFSRMYLYVHYPTDVLGGMIVGCAAGYFGNRLAAHLIRSWRQKMKKTEDRKNR